jgi:diaminohydroxyphosphoribosylaminopyrimidine deaminase/5-amino-6-(5-phosphoribosylamino)uracil reductase
MTASEADYRFMALALELAERGVCGTDPNPNVGCVLVNEAGEIVAQGWHRRAGEAHAEIAALAEAGEHARGCTAYVTLEPCPHHGRTPPCATALIDAGIRRVVYAMPDPNPLVARNGERMLIEAGLEVLGGVHEDAAAILNQGYVARMQRGRPWVRCKLATSIDGRTALASGESQWITGEAARADVHRWRARSSAVLTGIGTVLADDPLLTARSAEFSDALQPLRVVVDSNLRTPPDARLFSADVPVQVFYLQGTDERCQQLAAAGASLNKLASANGRVDLAALLDLLGKQQINDVWVEAGPTLNGALLEQGLIDEVIVYQAGCILGTDSQGMFSLSPLQTMQDRKELELTDLRKVGTDVRMIYRVNSGEKQ